MMPTPKQQQGVLGAEVWIGPVPSLSGKEHKAPKMAPTTSAPPVGGKGLLTASSLPLLFRWGDGDPQRRMGDPEIMW